MNIKSLLKTVVATTALLVVGSASAKDTKTLDVYWVDVEGGGGTLIVTPAGESILIDTGMPGGRDPGRLHEAATKVAGVKQIDHLITTHCHIDHFGGAAELSQKSRSEMSGTTASRYATRTAEQTPHSCCASSRTET